MLNIEYTIRISLVDFIIKKKIHKPKDNILTMTKGQALDSIERLLSEHDFHFFTKTEKNEDVIYIKIYLPIYCGYIVDLIEAFIYLDIEHAENLYRTAINYFDSNIAVDRTKLKHSKLMKEQLFFYDEYLRVRDGIYIKQRYFKKNLK